MENTLHGFNIITLAKRTQAKLIYPSSGNVYGKLNPPHREDMEPEPINLYGVAKVQAENMVKHSGIDAVGLRIFTGYGYGEERKGNLASVVCLFLLDMMKGKPPVIWGDGKQERDCIFIDDIIKSVINAAKFEVPEIINVGSGVKVTYNRIIEAINEVLGTNIEPIFFLKNNARLVFAYEPDPIAYKLALENIKLNNIDNVKIVNTGVRDKKGL
jgi:UDP-glucose 4-epimerase